MAEDKKDLTIIVLSYNSAEVIAAALSRLNREKYEMIAVDNASSDDSAKIIREHFPHIRLITTAQNIGYGRGNNLALKQVETDFALVLNPDAVFEEDSIERVLRVMKKDGTIALAGAMKFGVLENGKLVDEVVAKKASAGFFLGEDEAYYLTKFITGAAMFFNMKVMKEIGFFDEGFFLYGEDNELCKRTIRKGFKNVIVKDTKVVHPGGQSSKLGEEESEKICWHKYGWSKCYYTRCVHGVIAAKFKALRIIAKGLILALCEILRGKRIASSTKGMLRGSAGFLIGLKAFKENGESRG